MINHRNKQNYRFRTWKFRDRCHLKGGVRQGCFLSLILNNLIQYIHFHSLYITSHYYAKFKENPCVGTDARPPLYFFYQKCVHLGENTSIYCSPIIVVYVHATVFFLKLTQRVTILQTVSNHEVTLKRLISMLPIAQRLYVGA